MRYVGCVGLLVLLAFLLPLGAEELRLPEQAAEVRFQQGHFLLLVPVKPQPGLNSDTEIVLVDRAGRVRRRVNPFLPSGQGVRRIAVRDASLTPDGNVLASVSLERSLGRSQHGILEMRPDTAPFFRDLDGLVCERLLAEGKGAWCLGFDLALFVRKLPFDILYRLGPDGGRVPLLPIDKIGVRRLEDNGYAGPWSRSDLGPPILFPGSPGIAWAWMPNVNTLALADLNVGRVDLRQVPLQRAGRSFVSLAATARGRVFGLFPLRGKEEKLEALDTSYGFFEMNLENGKWLLMPRLGEVPRGAQLIGGDGEKLVLWFRPERKVQWRAVPSTE